MKILKCREKTLFKIERGNSGLISMQANYDGIEALFKNYYNVLQVRDSESRFV